MRTCNGESHKVYRGWLRDMEIVGNAVKHEPERMKALALRTLKGTAVDYFVGERQERCKNMAAAREAGEKREGRDETA